MRCNAVILVCLAVISCSSGKYSTYDDLFVLAPAQNKGVILDNIAFRRFYELRNELISSQVLRPYLYRVSAPRHGGIMSGVNAVFDLFGERRRRGMALLMETKVSPDNKLCYISAWFDLKDGQFVENELRERYSKVEVFEPRVAVPRGTDKYTLLLPGERVRTGFELVEIIKTGSSGGTRTDIN